MPSRMPTLQDYRIPMVHRQADEHTFDLPLITAGQDEHDRSQYRYEYSARDTDRSRLKQASAFRIGIGHTKTRVLPTHWRDIRLFDYDIASTAYRLLPTDGLPLISQARHNRLCRGRFRLSSARIFLAHTTSKPAHNTAQNRTRKLRHCFSTRYDCDFLHKIGISLCD